MEIVEIKNLVNYLTNNRNKVGGIFLYLFVNKKTKSNPIEIKQLVLERSLGDKLFWQSLNSFNEIIDFADESEISKLIEFDPDASNNDYNYFNTNTVPNLNEINELIINDQTDTYSKDYPYKHKIKSWIVRIEFQNENNNIDQIYLFQRFSRSKMLDRNKIFIFEQGEKYRALDDHALIINQQFDAVLINDKMVALSFNNFKTIFDYKEFIMNKAAEFYNEIIASQQLSEDITLVGFENLENKIKGSFTFSNKCFKIKQKQYYKKIKNVDLKELNRKYSFNLKIENGTWEIEEETDIKVVLSILNDEYNRSMLTGNEYLVDGKTELS